jgi:hypothetical protein
VSPFPTAGNQAGYFVGGIMCVCVCVLTLCIHRQTTPVIIKRTKHNCHSNIGVVHVCKMKLQHKVGLLSPTVVTLVHNK